VENQSCDSTVAVEKWVHPQQAMMRRGSWEDCIGSSQTAIDFFATSKKSRKRSWTNGDMLTDSYVATPEFTWHNSDPLTRIGIVNPEKLVREQLTEAQAADHRSVIDPLLNCDMCLGFELQVSLARIIAVVFKRPLERAAMSSARSVSSPLTRAFSDQKWFHQSYRFLAIDDP
jgi:hypothetical protein